MSLAVCVGTLVRGAGLGMGIAVLGACTSDRDSCVATTIELATIGFVAGGLVAMLVDDAIVPLVESVREIDWRAAFVGTF